MKTILLMTISTDGYISRPNDDAPWSQEEFARCNEFTKKAGSLVIGQKTYEIMREAGDFNNSIITVVLSKDSQHDIGNVHFVSSPQEAIQYLKDNNIETVVIGGGMTNNSGFIEAGLIDEIILDIEPVLLGKGLRLFREKDMDIKLTLKNTDKFSNAIRLHYQVEK